MPWNLNFSELLKRSLWILPFLSFLMGYQILAWLYRTDSLSTPSVIGKELQQAIGTLSAHNLNPRLLSYKEDSDIPAGTVLTQLPQAGTKIKPNQSVFLTIAVKPPVLRAPNLLGKSIPTCLHDLQDKRVRFKNFFLESQLPKDSCIGQWPHPGMELIEQNLIVYSASPAKKPYILPSFIGHPVTHIIELLARHNIKPSIIHQQPRSSMHECDASCIVQDQRPLPGSLIMLDAVQVHLQIR